MFGLEPCTHFYSTIAEDFSLGSSISASALGGGGGVKNRGKMINWHRKVLTCGREMSKIAKKVLTYFMDGPFSFFSGNAIYPGRESAAGAASSRLLFEDNGFKLRLDQLEMSDAANYSCQAENFYGRDAITYHLQVKCKPSVHTTTSTFASYNGLKSFDLVLSYFYTPAFWQNISETLMLG